MGSCCSEEYNDIRLVRKARSSTSTSSSHESKPMDETELKKKIARCFDRFDLDHDGFLDHFEFQQLVKAIYGQEESKQHKTEEFYQIASIQLMKTIDADNKGRINIKSFYRFYKKF